MIESHHLIINTTRIGMYPNNSEKIIFPGLKLLKGLFQRGESGKNEKMKNKKFLNSPKES